MICGAVGRWLFNAPTTEFLPIFSNGKFCVVSLPVKMGSLPNVADLAVVPVNQKAMPDFHCRKWITRPRRWQWHISIYNKTIHDDFSNAE